MTVSYAKYLYVKENYKYYFSFAVWSTNLVYFDWGTRDHYLGKFKYFNLDINFLYLDVNFMWKLSNPKLKVHHDE